MSPARNSALGVGDSGSARSLQERLGRLPHDLNGATIVGREAARVARLKRERQRM